MRRVRLSGWVVGGLLLTQVGLGQAQTAPPGPTYQGQLEQLQARIAQEYQQLVDSEILSRIPMPLKDPAEAQVAAIVSQLRIMTNRWGMEQARAQQLGNNIATYMEAVRAREATIKQQEAELLTLRQRPPAVAQTPEAPKD